MLTNYFEIRRLPLRIGREAELARRSYNSSVDCTIPTISSPTLIIICVLLPTVYSFYIFTVLYRIFPVAYLFFILSSFPSFHDTFFSQSYISYIVNICANSIDVYSIFWFKSHTPQGSFITLLLFPNYIIGLYRTYQSIRCFTHFSIRFTFIFFNYSCSFLRICICCLSHFSF